MRVSIDSLVFEDDERGPDDELKLQFESAILILKRKGNQGVIGRDDFKARDKAYCTDQQLNKDLQALSHWVAPQQRS